MKIPQGRNFDYGMLHKKRKSSNKETSSLLDDFLHNNSLYLNLTYGSNRTTRSKGFLRST